MNIRKAEKAEQRNEEKRILFEDAIANANMGEPPTSKQIQEYLSKTSSTISDWIKKYGYMIDKNNGGVVVKIPQIKTEDEKQG